MVHKTTKKKIKLPLIKPFEEDQIPVTWQWAIETAKEVSLLFPNREARSYAIGILVQTLLDNP